MNLDPNEILNQFAKSVNVSGYAGAIPSSLLARQDLESEIVKLTNRQTPLRDIMKREKGEGRAHLWNVRTALGGLPANNNPLELFYTDGGLPTQSDPIYLQKSAAYAYIGVTGVITGPMIKRVPPLLSSLNLAISVEPSRKRQYRANLGN